MIGLTSVDVNKTTFNDSEENNTFKPYKILGSKSDGVSYEKVTGENEKN